MREFALAPILSPMPTARHERYGRYVEYYGLVKSAVEAGDTVQLWRIESVITALPRDERKVSSVAIHDVALQLPMRSEAHLVDLVAEDWDGADEYFVQLLEALRARVAMVRAPAGR